MKIVINKCFGGFGLSHEGVMHYAKLKGIRLYPVIDHINLHHYSKVPTDDAKRIPNDQYFSIYDIPRDDQDLVSTVATLGARAQGKFSKLEIIEIPDGVKWGIDEYDGVESIHETHKSWG